MFREREPDVEIAATGGTVFPRGGYAIALVGALAIVWVPQALDARWPDMVARLLAEDGPYESAQAGLYLAAAIAWFAAARQRGESLIGRASLLLAALGSTVSLGEEVSWGQRLFGWETPSGWRERSFQGETTVHNLMWFQTTEEGNALQIAWLAGLVLFFWVWPFAVWLRRGAHWPAACPSVILSGTFLVAGAGYLMRRSSSEVLETFGAWLVSMAALESFHRARVRGGASGRPAALAVGAGVIAAVLIALVARGEAALPSVRSDAAYRAGGEALARHQWEEAENRFTEAVRIWPLHAQAWLALGELQAQRGERNKAEQAFRRAIAADPALAVACLRLAGLQADLGRAEDARETLERGQRRFDESSGWWFERALVELRIGRCADAICSLEAALARDPNQMTAANTLAWVLATSTDERCRDAERAVRWAERATLPIEKASANRLDTLAAAYASAGRFDDALRVVESALTRAEMEGNANLAALIEQRRAGYKEHRAWRETTGGDGTSSDSAARPEALPRHDSSLAPSDADRPGGSP